jgi:FkbM family methyltransferase
MKAKITTRYGEMEIIEADTIVSKSLELYGEWAENELSFLKNFINPGDTILDIGAFIGSHALAFSAFTGDNGRVLAFEPRKEIFEYLKRNCEQKNNITCFQMALGQNEGVLQGEVLDISKNINFGALSLKDGQKNASNHYDILGNALDNMPLPIINFIKIDTEGMEFDVIQGAEKLIRRDKPVIAVEANSLEQIAPVINFLKAERFIPFAHNAKAFNPENYNKTGENIFQGSTEITILFIHDEKAHSFLSKQAISHKAIVTGLDSLCALFLRKPQFHQDVIFKQPLAKHLEAEELKNKKEDCKWNMQLFLERNGAFSEENSILTELIPGKTSVLRARNVPASGKLKFRLDPMDGPGGFIVKKISVTKTGDDEEIISFPQRQDFELTKFTDILPLPDAFYSLGNDPQMFFEMPVPDGTFVDIRIELEANFEKLSQERIQFFTHAQDINQNLRLLVESLRKQNLANEMTIKELDLQVRVERDAKSALKNTIDVKMEKIAMLELNRFECVEQVKALEMELKVNKSALESEIKEKKEEMAALGVLCAEREEAAKALKAKLEVETSETKRLSEQIVALESEILANKSIAIQKQEENREQAIVLDSLRAECALKTSEFESLKKIHAEELEKINRKHGREKNNQDYVISVLREQKIAHEQTLHGKWKRLSNTVASIFRPEKEGQRRECRFNLDNWPKGKVIPSKINIEGWFMDSCGNAAKRIYLKIGGNRINCSLFLRKDVNDVFHESVTPEEKLAFQVELKITAGPKLLELYAVDSRGENHCLRRQLFWVAEKRTKHTTTDLGKILRFMDVPCVEVLPETKQETKKITVIVPVYRDVALTEKCIELAMRDIVSRTERGLIAINDRSPENEMQAMLAKLQKKYPQGLTIIENAQNVGFVKTVNIGLKIAKDSDVIFLNSDALVPKRWISRLQKEAYSSKKIGTVTPLSNNAGICSFPNFMEENSNYGELDFETIDLSFSASELPNEETPTGVGFCMYVKNECLANVGNLDEEHFGRGYGEETDFCQRALKKGWKNIITPNIYVEHRGSVSFLDEKNPRLENARKQMDAKHPNYAKSAGNFLQKDPLKLARLARLTRLLKDSDRPVVLLISHNLGGGTQQHIDELALHYSEEIHFLLLQPGPIKGTAILTLGFPISNQTVVFDFKIEYELFQNFLKSISISLIHFHHLLGFPRKIFFLPEEIRVAYLITVHDFYLLGGDPTLTDAEGVFHSRFVDEPPGKLPYSETIEQWRSRNSIFLENAVRVVFPSESALKIFSKIFSFPNFQVVPHLEENRPLPAVYSVKVLENPVTIGTFGAMSPAKGLARLLKVCELAKKSLKFVHIGPVEKADSLGELEVTGKYEPTELQNLIREKRIDIVFFPARWPETYSYTLSYAMAAGLPIFAPDIGAFPERLRNWPFAHIFPLKADAYEIFSHLCEFIGKIKAAPKQDFPISLAENIFYLRDFPSFPRSRNGKSLPAVVFVSGCPDASYRYRVENQAASLSNAGFNVEIFPSDFLPEERLNDFSGVLVCHRTALTPELKIQIEGIKKRGGITIYDTDDFIFDVKRLNELNFYANLSESEKKHFKNYVAGNHETMKIADAILVATPALAENASALFPTQKIVVSQNRIGDDLLNLAWEKLKEPKTNSATVKIAYFSGTKSHQEDFAVCHAAVEDMLSKFPFVELVIVGFLDVTELQERFPERVKKIEYCPWAQLPNIYREIDINLAPLEGKNEFTRCKSDLKYFEAAIMKIPTIASKIDPFSGSIQDGSNGFLCATDKEWREKLEILIHDASLRTSMGGRAYTHVLQARTIRNNPNAIPRIFESLIKSHPNTKRLRSKKDDPKHT